MFIYKQDTDRIDSVYKDGLTFLYLITVSTPNRVAICGGPRAVRKQPRDSEWEELPSNWVYINEKRVLYSNGSLTH